MKHLAFAAACAVLVTASPSLAGSLSDPVVTPEVVAADTVDQSGDIAQVIIPLMLIMIIVGMGI